ncbi:MAG TPA: YbaK/EbsC family protein [Bryobacteraceae bacterium]|nr:YbaK/EbsC family protein [Bryobacteraceae bacterium]
MPARKLKEFLDAQHIKYRTLVHPTAYTAQEIAALAHIRGQELAKTVIVKVDGTMAMAVVPASRQVDLPLLRRCAKATSVVLATEEEFHSQFPGCEIGAMPPFGNLYGMPVFADESLAEDQWIAFNAGTHTELIQIAYQDFARVVHPQTAVIAVQAAHSFA